MFVLIHTYTLAIGIPRGTRVSDDSSLTILDKNGGVEGISSVLLAIVGFSRTRFEHKM